MEESFSLQEEVMVLERILLQTIKFDLQVEHPYQFLLRYAKQLKGLALMTNVQYLEVYSLKKNST